VVNYRNRRFQVPRFNRLGAAEPLTKSTRHSLWPDENDHYLQLKRRAIDLRGAARRLQNGLTLAQPADVAAVTRELLAALRRRSLACSARHLRRFLLDPEDVQFGFQEPRVKYAASGHIHADPIGQGLSFRSRLRRIAGQPGDLKLARSRLVLQRDGGGLP